MSRTKKHSAFKIVKALNKYIDETDKPTIQQFCADNKVSKFWLYQTAKYDSILKDTMQVLIAKQEAYLYRGLIGEEKLSTPGCKFALSQPAFGYSDKEVSENPFDFENDFSHLSDDELLDKLKEVIEVVSREVKK